MLSNQAVTKLIYHCIMLLEFAQILFFVFYKVEIIDEFKINQVSNKVLVTNSANETDIQDNSTAVYEIQNSFEYSAFTIDFYFTFINFELYTLKSSSTNTFFLLYGLMSGVFIIFIMTLFIISKRAFEGAKLEDLKEGEKILVKVLTLVMTLFLFILQIPFITILLQGYLCDEDPSISFTLPDISCNSLTHRLMMVFSTFTLTLYVLFLVLQQQLYASNNFESTLPWSSMERRLSIMRVIYKLVITACFVFDKRGKSRGLVGLVCFFICAFITFKRQTSALIFNKWVYYATIFYETSTTWLYLNISLHILSGTDLTVMTFSLIVGSCFFVSLALMIYQEIRRASNLQLVHPERLEEPQQYELYFYRLYELIEDNSPQAAIEYIGIVYNHVHYCDTPGCICKNIIEGLDDIKRYRKLRQKEEEEQHQIALQNRMDRESSIQENHTSAISIPIPITMKSTKRLGIPITVQKRDTMMSMMSMQGGGASQISVNGTTEKRKRPSFNQVVKGLARKPTEKKEGLAILTEGIKFSMHPETQNLNFDGDEHKKFQSVAMARKIAILMEENKYNNSNMVEHNEIFQKEAKKLKRREYKFLAMLVRDAIEKFPKNIDLKIVNAFIQKSKIHNGFKAIFELMNCELCNPSFHDQFIIFRRKIEVENTLIKSHNKNIQKVGQLDVTQVYNYEKQVIPSLNLNRQFLRYQIYEYQTVNAALTFWRELLQKHIDASILQEKGNSISKNYECIQDLANKLFEIYPNEIKFLYRYGTFLLNIINNEYDAIATFEKAVNILQNKLSKKSGTTTAVGTEQSTFGENSASAIILISATSTDVGKIIHANDEIEQVLNYKRNDVIGKNISLIMPRPIGKVHDRFIHRYFETAKPTVIDIQRQLFGRNKEGYLKEVDLIVKVYPEITEQIIFVGFIQRAKCFNGMDPPKSEFSAYDHQYMVTDSDGNITNVTEGLNFDLGLNAKFFNYTDSIFQQMFNIQKICPTIMEQEITEILEMEGGVLEFDTRGILNNIELEQLTSDEILEVRSNLSQQSCFVQLKKLILDQKFCTIMIYRIIILPKNAQTFGNTQFNAAQDQLNSRNSNLNSDFDLHSVASGGTKLNPGVMSVANSSISSQGSSTLTFNSIIKDFKKALSERKTPLTLVLLNRIMIIILIATIILSSAIFQIDKNQMTDIDQDNMQSLNCESRNVQMTQMALTIRSLVNVAGGIEFQRYEGGGSLSSVDRFLYLQELIQEQAYDLSETHEYMGKQRGSPEATGLDNNNVLSEFEYSLVDLYRLDSSNRISIYRQPYRVAMSTFLNNILVLNKTSRSQLVLDENLLKSASNENSTHVYNITSQVQKTAFFLIANGMRSMRTKSQEVADFQRMHHTQFQQSPIFMGVMITGVIISSFSIVAILYQIYIIERNKGEILSLYALLSMKDINKVFQKCQHYMNHLDDHRIFGSQAIEQENDIIQGENQDNPNEPGDAKTPKLNVLKASVRRLQKYQISAEGFGMSMPGMTGMTGMLQEINNAENDSQMSEEEKEAIAFKQYMYRKKINRMKAGGGFKPTAAKTSGISLQPYKNSNMQMYGGELYLELIKRNFEEINEKEEELRRIQREEKMKQQANKAEPSPFLQKEKKSVKLQNLAEISADEVNSEKKRKKKKRKDTQQEGQKQKKKDDSQDEKETSSEDEEEKERREEEELQKLKEQMEASKSDMTQEEIEIRQKNFFRTIRTSSWGTVLINVVFGLIFGGYFIQVSLLHSNIVDQMIYLRKEMPIFFNRYNYLMLQYSFLREKIINNNTLFNYEKDPNYGIHLDEKYNDLSTENEQYILQLKNSHNSILAEIIDLTMQTDSELLCPDVINAHSSTLQTVQEQITPEMQNLAKTAYQQQIMGTIQALLAAESGDLKTLQSLQLSGVDLSAGDYDRRTPLHVAVRAEKIEAVRYLVTQAQVKVNMVDRWGATPLSYSVKGSDIQLILISRGAIQGSIMPKIAVRQIRLQQNEYRMFYAALNNDIKTLKGVRDQIYDINIQDSEGRTALAIASSEGYIETVKYLVSQGSLHSIQDARGNDALDDAKRENHQDVVEYFTSYITETVINDYCINFSDGLLRKGMPQAIGNFRKRFADLQIKLNQLGQTSHDRMKLLLSPQGQPGDGTYNSQLSTIQTFFSAVELYFHHILEYNIDAVKSTFSQSTGSYNSTAQLIYLIFLAIQIIILLFLRTRLIAMMKDDIFESRGILNLIPDDFFEQNKQSVEKLIKQLRN